MIVYNVTTKVAKAIAREWLKWLKEEHIPDMIGTGCFNHAIIHRLLETEDTEGPTFVVQYHAESKARYNLYLERYAGNMRQKAFEKWGDAFIAFRTIMQIED
jgi:Domain of unknown function (DUF4286)